MRIDSSIRGFVLVACGILSLTLLSPISWGSTGTPAQAAPASTAAATSAHSAIASPQTIDAYIGGAWQTLTRSMTSCTSLADPKLKTAPILYLPKEIPEPQSVASLTSKCGVEVKRLPVRIAHPGTTIRVSPPGLLYLPNPYVVPGGRFNEMYGWDSYFIILGLLHDGRVALARGMVENFFFEIEHYGEILNANRTYYFTRSQPPFLSSMIRAVYEAEAAGGRGQEAREWLARAYLFAQRDHALWESPIHRAGGTGLARYYDTGDGPVPEMADDDAYYQQVIRWLLVHPEIHTHYLVRGWETPNAAQQAVLARLSCDPRLSQRCARAHVGGYWLSRDFYKGDRAMRESGFDTTFRFGPYSGSTEDYAPVCLNALLYKYEGDLAWMAATLHRPAEVKKWNTVALRRRTAIDKYLWNPQKGMYFDYEFGALKGSERGRQSGYMYLTTYYPLWAGAANAAQARQVEEHLHLFEKLGGLAMSTYASGVQWDLPYGWAPVNWLAVAGMIRYGDRTDGVRAATDFMTTVRNNFACEGIIREKYDVVTSTSEVAVTAGYRQNVVGFGWTNAVYLKMEELVNQAGGAQPGATHAIPPC